MGIESDPDGNYANFRIFYACVQWDRQIQIRSWIFMAHGGASTSLRASPGQINGFVPPHCTICIEDGPIEICSIRLWSSTNIRRCRTQWPLLTRKGRMIIIIIIITMIIIMKKKCLPRISEWQRPHILKRSVCCHRIRDYHVRIVPGI